jgi:hypothetical protein
LIRHHELRIAIWLKVKLDRISHFPSDGHVVTKSSPTRAALLG